VILFLGGDVMTGRGVDQILPHPGEPTLWEAHVKHARDYVTLAEATNGPIPRPVDFSWPWGDALQLLDQLAPDLRIVNLETSITSSADVAFEKGVHYRMNPANIPCLATAGLDGCTLANNHVLDFGRRGLLDTLDALTRVGIRPIGAGRSAMEAAQPAILTDGKGSRVIVLALGAPTSGIPSSWAATADRPGITFLRDLSPPSADEVVQTVAALKHSGDVVVASVHWGSNWGYDVTSSQVEFAHRLVDGGVDVLHGHSSHHPRPVEVYRDRLILYGCGDLIDDYEGIGGYDRYRDDLRLLWFASLDASDGALEALRMAPMQARRMRLRHADPDDREWLRTVLDKISRPFGARIELDDDQLLILPRP
jgi:poly-gamma-glutamate capsule biosynthesis protein CapA/YwtB (metallophosphatase superfamily)